MFTFMGVLCDFIQQLPDAGQVRGLFWVLALPHLPGLAGTLLPVFAPTGSMAGLWGCLGLNQSSACQVEKEWGRRKGEAEGMTQAACSCH